MNAVKSQIAELVSVELERAKEDHEDFHSLHEGYAVLLEEIDESRDELQIVQADAGALWRCVKDDNVLGAKLTLTEIEDAAVRLAAEAVQVAAMARKAAAKAANLMVCRSACSRLPTAQSKIEARHRCLQPATNPIEDKSS